MTKNEFLEGLRKALGNDLDRETVQENVAYYDGYISVQVNIGSNKMDCMRYDGLRNDHRICSERS